MGEVSVWDWMIIFMCLAALLAAVAVINRAVARGPRRPAGPSRARPVPPQSTERSKEARLQELASLRSEGLITEAEYEQRRLAILQGVQAGT